MADLAFSKIFQLQGLGSLIIGQMSSAGEAIQQFMTVLFAYLATAHLIGASLERRQVTIFTCLYLLWQFSTLLVFGIRSYSTSTTIAAVHALDANVVAPPSILPQVITVSWVVLLLGALVASLYFMWAVRHPKSE